MKRLILYFAILSCIPFFAVHAETDLTFCVTNPNFNGNANGWTVNMPGAQNKGYQGASYSSGSAYVSQFIEAWIPTPGTLGEGSISQTIYGLPSGTYILEADVIASYQSGVIDIVEGAMLFAQDDEKIYDVPVASGSGSPQHFSCEFTLTGDELTIGMRTTAMTSVNWIAFDNVRLIYYGTSDATRITLSPSKLSMVIDETQMLTASVNSSNKWLNRVTWSSDDESIASVNEEGYVIAQAEGSTTIRAVAVASKISSSVKVSVTGSNPAGLLINEIQVANIDQFIDPSYNYGGWVELYNPTNSAISLGGMYVSKDANDLLCFQLPKDFGAVPAYGYKNIWFDHYDTGNKQSSSAYKQVDFKLDYEGGTIFISDSEGKLLLSQTYPQAIQRVSYARKTDGSGEWAMTSTPTPEAGNNGSLFATRQLEAPVVDKDATVYTDSFNVNVTIPAGATLRYTTDGSTPTLENGETSTTGQFRVSKGNYIFRFRLFQDGYLPSAVVTRSYLYKDKDYYLPIVSVVTDAANLYDNTIGAYTVGTNGITGNGISTTSNKNRDWERPVNFEYLTTNDDGGSFLMALNQEVDFEVCGGWSRNLFAPAASFRLKGNKYNLGQNFLPYAFFEDKPYIKNKGVVVRNGGNDGYGRIHDAGIHEVILRSGFYMDCQAYQPVHVFINGQFKFTFNLREPNNKNHGYSNYGIDSDEMDQFEINGSMGYQQKTGDDVAFRRWMSLAQELAENPTDDAVFAEICKLVDIDEYCNYMAAECYSGCNDWLTNCNNVKGYRSRADGKFHLIFMDQDQGFSSTNMIGSLKGSLYDSRYDTGKSFLIDIFLNMLKYEPFKKQFIDAFCIVNGSVFEENRMVEIITSMKDHALKAMSFEGNSSSLTSSANSLISAISSHRASTMSNLSKYFSLNTTYTVNLSSNIEGCNLMINGQEVPTGKFTGPLFGPVTLSAKTPAGYRFKGWSVSGSDQLTDIHTLFSTNDQWYYYDQGSLDGTDWKSLTYKPTLWATGYGPFGYGNVGMEGTRDYATTLSYGDNSQKKNPTYYFRNTFSLSQAPSDDEVYQLTFYVDDGFVAYVNGVEVGRHLINGTPSYDTYTTNYVGSTTATGVITIDNNLLQKGENVIAVEVHNTSATSSDIYWGASLIMGRLSDVQQVSTETELDLSTFGSTNLSLVASYEKLPDEELLADLAMPVKVNEVSAANSVFVNDVFKKNDWLELYNTTDTDINVAGLYVSDDIDNPLKYQIPSSTVLNTIVPAHGHLILWADKLEAVTQLHVDFKLNNGDGKLVFITSSEEFVENNADFFTRHPELKDFADGIVYTTHAGNQSVGRYPDGGNLFYRMERPSIENTNSLRTFDVNVGTDEGFMDYGRSTLSLDLAEGWNWVSHPFTHALSVNRFKDYADRILGNTLETAYSSQTGMMEGALKTLSAGQLYKFQMSESHVYELDEQVPATPSAISLHEGWNWIGYPVLGTQTVTAAFTGSDVEVGDIVVGQGGFSVYDATDGWVGTLSTLMPGQGYLYKSETTKRVQIHPAVSKVRLRRPASARMTDSNGIDRYAFPNVMGIIATLALEDAAFDATRLKVLAYADETCRGCGEWVDGQLFLTLYGQGGEDLTFKVSTEAGDELDIRETLSFTPDVVGTRAEPVVLHVLGNLDTGIVGSQPSASSMPAGYYNLYGIFAGRRSDVLRPGIYIVRQSDGSTQKVIIK